MGKVHLSVRVPAGLKIDLENEVKRIRFTQTEIVIYALEQGLKQIKECTKDEAEKRLLSDT